MKVCTKNKVLCATVTFAQVALLSSSLSSCSDGGNVTEPDNQVTQTDMQSPPTDQSDQSILELLSIPIETATPFSNIFDDDRISEISGVQRSGNLNGLYYVHNDSGNEPILFVTDAQAMVLGSMTVTGINNPASSDWEAIAGARLNGVAHIVIGDIGDNEYIRTDLKLLVIEEPDFNVLTPGFDINVSSRDVNVVYSDGVSRNSEALFIDGDNDTVVVLTKDEPNTTSPAIWRGSLSSALTNGNLVLEYYGLLPLDSLATINAITDVDIHPDGRQLAVLTYGLLSTGKIMIWTPADMEGTVDALTRAPNTTVTVPLIGSNYQAEGISYSSDGTQFLVGAEGAAVSSLSVLNAPVE